MRKAWCFRDGWRTEFCLWTSVKFVPISRYGMETFSSMEDLLMVHDYVGAIDEYISV